MLTSSELILIAILLGLFGLLFIARLKMELVAILVLLALSFSGLVTPQQALSGFSSSVVITLIGLFVITRGLEDTGVVQWIGGQLNRLGNGAELRLIPLFMLAGSTLSLIMNNVAAGAMLLPAAVHVSKSSDVPVSRLLMPLSFGTLVGGMATYLTTANIVMSELLLSRDLDGLNMFDFMPTGGLIVLATVLYMSLIGRRLLPERDALSVATMLPDLQQTYQLGERFWEVPITPDSELAGLSLRESKIGERLGLTVVAISRGRQIISAPSSDERIQTGDRLLVIGRQERVDHLRGQGAHLLRDAERERLLNDMPGETAEIVIAPRSNAVGKTLSQLKFRDQFGLIVVALWRENRAYRTDVGKRVLEVGDALLVMGEANDVQALAENRNYIVLSESYASTSFRLEKAPFAALITALVLAVAIFDLFSLPLVMLSGAALMVLAGCIEMDDFYEAVEWRVIFLIAAMLPLSVAISETGLADRVGMAMVNLLADSSGLILVTGMILLTMAVVQIIGGQVTALLIGPIAINAALQSQVDPQAMAVAVAMTCSMAFLTPIAHPVNLLVMGPGGYHFGDFSRVGVGMTLVTIATMLLGLILFWGLR
ncbi:MAG: SLC13 family permease [Chloroflexi bacterium]|nr:SLC13 family permease [Chloroflexota bacterium]